MRKKLGENLSDMLDLPKNTFLDLPQIVATGNKEIYIENYKGILEYSDTLIRLNIGNSCIRISGEELDIRSIGEEDITLGGNIKCIEFC